MLSNKLSWCVLLSHEDRTECACSFEQRTPRAADTHLVKWCGTLVVGPTLLGWQHCGVDRAPVHHMFHHKTA